MTGGPALKRALAPATNPTGIGSAAAAIYAAVVMIVNAAHHHAVIDPQVVIAALAAAAFLYSRMKVTPVADPKDGNGQPLAAASAPQPVITVNATGSADIGRQVAAAMKAYEGRRGTFAQPEVGLPSGYEPPSAALTPPEKTLRPPAAPE